MKKGCKDNPFATNQGGIIRGPKSTVKDSPRAESVKGDDLRSGKKHK